MNKNIRWFFSIILIIPFSTSLAAMDSGNDQPSADLKKATEKQSPPACSGKKGKHKKTQSALALPNAAAAASMPLQAATSPAAPATVPAQPARPIPVAALHPLLIAPAADEAEDDLEPIVKQAPIEIELNPADTVSFIQQKATNYLLGTHNTLLTRLRSLEKNVIVSRSLGNQAVILSAVKNLVELCGVDNCVLKKACLDDIDQLLNFAKPRNEGKPVITLDKGPADSLKEFLDSHQKKLFAAFYATYLEQIKPVRQIAGLIEAIDKIGGDKPSDDVNLTSLSHANMQALDKIMLDMAGQKPVGTSDSKHNA